MLSWLFFSTPGCHLKYPIEPYKTPKGFSFPWPMSTPTGMAWRWLLLYILLNQERTCLDLGGSIVERNGSHWSTVIIDVSFGMMLLSIIFDDLSQPTKPTNGHQNVIQTATPWLHPRRPLCRWSATSGRPSGAWSNLAKLTCFERPSQASLVIHSTWLSMLSHLSIEISCFDLWEKMKDSWWPWDFKLAPRQLQPLSCSNQCSYQWQEPGQTAMWTVWWTEWTEKVFQRHPKSYEIPLQISPCCVFFSNIICPH